MRAYYHGYRREGLAGVHIVRESELKTYRRSLYPPGERAWCGQDVNNHTRSPVVDVDPTQPLGEGLHWHWPCVFAHALHLGLLEMRGRSLAADAVLRDMYPPASFPQCFFVTS